VAVRPDETDPARGGAIAADELTPEEWVRQFNAWVEGHHRTTRPVFSVSLAAIAQSEAN
jgi:hypothetical protein